MYFLIDNNLINNKDEVNNLFDILINETDLDIKETVASGNTYKNVSTSGTSFGGGYQKFLGDSNFGIRLEGNYVEFDNVKTDNGAGSGSVATGGLNTVEANDLEGITGKIALTFTLGRN